MKNSSYFFLVFFFFLTNLASDQLMFLFLLMSTFTCNFSCVLHSCLFPLFDCICAWITEDPVSVEFSFACRSEESR